MPGGVSVKDSVTDFTPGAVNATKGPLDVAISGSGFFKVSDGKQSYLTRDGQFSMNARGELVTTQHGLQVLGSGNAPITGIDPSRPVRIDIDGSIRQGEDFISQLQVVEPENLNDLHKAGRNLYSTQGRQRPVNPDNSPVQQGFLEASTVNPVSEMTQIIETSRAFEANINMIKHQDEALGRLLSSLPRK